MPDILEAQRALGIGYSKMWRMIRDGKIDATMQAGKWVVPDAEIERVRRERAGPPVDALAARLGDDGVLAQIQAYHILRVKAQAIYRALCGDLAEVRQNEYESADYVATLERILELLPTSQYSWTGDAWRIEVGDGSSVESRSVSEAEPVEVVDVGTTNGKG